MSEEFTVEIVNPEKSFFSKEDVKEAILPAFEGEMGILKDHISIISFLIPSLTWSTVLGSSITVKKIRGKIMNRITEAKIT